MRFGARIQTGIGITYFLVILSCNIFSALLHCLVGISVDVATLF